MLKSVRVPAHFEPPFARAEAFVEQLFSTLTRRAGHAPRGQRAVEFIYNTAREIGRTDSASFSSRLGLTDGLDRLASGPVHFAHAGWALVDILPDSRPAKDDTYYLHYYHPNTFESEVLLAQKKTRSKPACLFSAGYSAGWCSDAFEVEVHGREVRCVASGDTACEFIMGPSAQLDGYQEALRPK